MRRRLVLSRRRLRLSGRLEPLRRDVRQHAERPDQLRHLRPCLRRQRGVHGRSLRAGVLDGLRALPHRLRRKRVLPAHLALGARLLPTPGRLGERGILLRPVSLLTATPAGCPGPAAWPPGSAARGPPRDEFHGRTGEGRTGEIENSSFTSNTTPDPSGLTRGAAARPPPPRRHPTGLRQTPGRVLGD